MNLSNTDRANIAAVLASENITQDESELKIRDGILWLRIKGKGLDNGRAALKALLDAGLNQVIDEDFSTFENSVIWAAGASHSTVWIDFVDNEPLFRVV